MELTAQTEKDLRVKTSEELNKRGLNTTPESLDPNNESLLKKIGDSFGDEKKDVLHALNVELEELTSGEDIHTRDRVASRNPINLALERFKKLKVTKKAS